MINSRLQPRKEWFIGYPLIKWYFAENVFLICLILLLSIGLSDQKLQQS